MKYAVEHKTVYEYESPVSHGRHVIRKRPRPLPFQTVRGSSLTVDPAPVWSRREQDYFGNEVDYVEVLVPHERLEVVTRSEVLVGRRPIDEGLPLFKQTWETVRDRVTSDGACFFAREMTLGSPLVPLVSEVKEFARETFLPGRALLDAVLDLNQRIYEDFTYDPHVTEVATPLVEVLAARHGVCQDFAHVAVGALRCLGLPARYVSGYLETAPPPGRPRLVGADASHAWVSVFVPDFGWIDFDPTNGVLPGERHIVVAWGRDFSDVSPLRGVVLGGGRHTLTVSVDVAPLPEVAESASVLPRSPAVSGELNPASSPASAPGPGPGSLAPR